MGIIKMTLKNKFRHPFHLVTPSPWPLLVSLYLAMLAANTVLYLHTYEYGGILALVAFIGLSVCLFGWWSDVVMEAFYMGKHTKVVQRGLRYGMYLFILTELLFFIGFFWAFFHSALCPTMQIACVWPPLGIETIDPRGLPLLNTYLLLASGFYATIAHKLSKVGVEWYADAITACLVYAILHGVVFTCIQLYEYITASFDITDSVYGSVFYVCTGFHGLHVIVGTVFLTVALIRHYFGHFSGRHYFNIEASIWYWHFVDGIWLFLYMTLYIWGS